MKLLPNTKVRIKTRVEIVPEESVLSGNFYYDDAECSYAQ